MKFQITDRESHQARIPHEIFLTNLIANHILWFVAALGMVKTFWQPLALVPVFSFVALSYILWRARRSRRVDSWYVMCHWQIAARRSLIFLGMLVLLMIVSALGWAGYTRLGMMKEAVLALIGGIGILPVMVTVLVLIIMESDVLYQAMQHRLPKGIQTRHPNPGVAVIADAPASDGEQGGGDPSSLG